MLLLLARLALAAPVAVGTSLTAGPEAHLQQGVLEARPSVDLLDLEVHVGRWVVVPRVGRWLVGVAALQIQDLEVDVLYRLDDGDALVAVGAGPRLAVGAAQVVGGGRLLARLGWTHRRLQLFAEPYVTGVTGTEVDALGLGVRGGLAITWEVAP